MISRRQWVQLVVSFAVSEVNGGNILVAQEVPTRDALDKLLDTKEPQRHCREAHDHADDQFDDWRASLIWAAADCGHNTGAAAVLRFGIENGLLYPEFMHGCQSTENLLPRVEETLKNRRLPSEALGMLSREKAALVNAALRHKKPVTEILSMAPEDALGVLWTRRAMVAFARTLVLNGKVAPAVAIATATQWHNCQAFRCLLQHSTDTARWLRG